jgi:hypothetical protein
LKSGQARLSVLAVLTALIVALACHRFADKNFLLIGDCCFCRAQKESGTGKIFRVPLCAKKRSF